MNEKFFDLSSEKQDAIINGALNVFSRYEYKKASTDEIAEKAGVSKPLLFHYFESKKGMYLYIYNYSIDFVVSSMGKMHDYKKNDFFEILVDAQMCKVGILAKHPDVMNFITKAYFEESPAVEPFIKKSFGSIVSDSSERFLKRADVSKFKDDIDPTQVLNIILWMSDGYMKSATEEQLKDLKKINDDYLTHLEVLRKHFYKPEFI